MFFTNYMKIYQGASIAFILAFLFLPVSMLADAYSIDSIDRLYVTNAPLAQVRIDSLQRRCEKNGYKECSRGHLEMVYSLILSYRHQPALAVKHAHQAFLYASQDKDYHSLFTALQLLIDSELSMGFNKLAVEHINRMKAYALNAPKYYSDFYIPMAMSYLAMSYSRSQDVGKCVALLNRALKLSENTSSAYILYYGLSMQKAECYANAKKYGAAERVLKTVIRRLDADSRALRGGIDRAGYDINYLEAYSLLALIEFHLGKRYDADLAFANALKLYPSYPDVPELKNTMAEYLSLTKQYDRLDRFVEPVVDFSVQSKEMLQLVQLLLQSYIEQGRLHEANTLYGKYVALDDTIKARNSDCALEEMSIAYHTYDLQKKVALQKSYIFSAIIILLLFAFIIVAIVIYTRKLKRLYKSARSRVDEFMERQDRLSPFQASSPKDDADTDVSAFCSLDARIKKDKPFLDYNFGRDELAAFAKLDKNKLTEVVKSGAKVTPNKYINQLRIVHAVELLRSKPGYSIESIAGDSGFGNRATFYRVFTDTFGITPVQYRRVQESEECDSLADKNEE